MQEISSEQLKIHFENNLKFFIFHWVFFFAQISFSLPQILLFINVTRNLANLNVTPFLTFKKVLSIALVCFSSLSEEIYKQLYLFIGFQICLHKFLPGLIFVTTESFRYLKPALFGIVCYCFMKRNSLKKFGDF